MARAEYIQSRKINALGVTGNARSVALPSVPTITEAGLPGYEATSFWGLLAPAKTPAEIVRKLNAVAIDALKNTELRDAYIRQGNEPAADSAEAFAALIQSDTIKWARVIKSTGIRLDGQWAGRASRMRNDVEWCAVQFLKQTDYSNHAASPSLCVNIFLFPMNLLKGNHGRFACCSARNTRSRS